MGMSGRKSLNDSYMNFFGKKIFISPVIKIIDSLKYGYILN